jgi:hypothetical protein
MVSINPIAIGANLGETDGRCQSTALTAGWSLPEAEVTPPASQPHRHRHRLGS